MDQYVTGAVIKSLREARRLTQTQLARQLNISDKTVSKWETGRGYPDITLLEPLAEVFGVTLTELLSGVPVRNRNPGANMLRSGFYVCPVCGNLIHSMGEAVVCCHGIRLSTCTAETPDAAHEVSVKRIENEYYVRVEHEMTKDHYISFIAAVSPDRLQTVKLYPEWDAEARFRIDSVQRIYYYCNRDGLYSLDPIKEIKANI